MNTRTADALAEIRNAAAAGSPIVPAFFSRFHGRAASAAAFRLAIAEGIIEVAYVSASGGNVYRAAGMADAIAEAAGATKH